MMIMIMMTMIIIGKIRKGVSLGGGEFAYIRTHKPRSLELLILILNPDSRREVRK